MLRRKLALLIAEGGSDAAALSVPIQNYLRNNGDSCIFECVIYRTDITIQSNKNTGVLDNPTLVLDRVKEAVDEFINSSFNSNKYKHDDIGLVMTLSDLDCCYCDNNDIVFGGQNCLTAPDILNKKYQCNDVRFIVESRSGIICL